MKTEGRWILFFSAAIILATSLPYVNAAVHRGDDWVFTGFLFAVEDGNSYIAKMLNGAHGDWLFRSPYAAEPQAGALLYLPYLLLGKMIGPRGSHAEFVIAFHLFRVVAIVAMCFATYAFISLFTADRFYRRLGLAFALLGGGLGWLVLLAGDSQVFGSLPLEFYSPETFGFLGLFGIPHLAMARALLLWGLFLYLKQSRSYGLQAAVWLGLAITHPLNAALGLLLISFHILFLVLRREPSDLPQLRNSVFYAILGAGPILAINLVLYARDAYLQSWAAQNLITSPHPAHYLLAYGLVLPFAGGGLRNLLRNKSGLASFVAIWMIALPFLLYVPFSLQRRFAEGGWVLLVCLVLCFFDGSVSRKRHLYALGLFSLSIFSTLGLILGAWQESNHLGPPVFRRAEEAAAFSFLTSQERKSVVLASYETGNALPAWAPVRVLLGHGPESVNFEDMATSIEAFYQSETTDRDRLKLIEEFNIDYVFWGPAERALGSWMPLTTSFLEEAFSEAGYSIFLIAND